ncbi:MAG: hypothetical protein NTW25_15745, partial [Candidatus Kapabacteria bacterium]|nr:hypothetical protein [Candidatus Kapabacteria bacterium]
MLEKKHIEATTKKKSNNKIILIILSYFGKFLKILIGSWLFLIIFCGIAAQFYGFRHWAIRNLLLIVNKELDSNLAIDDMTFDNNGNIVIEKVVINKLNDTIANINRIELDISLLDLIDNRIKVNYLNLANSKLNFEYNIKDSTWNFEHIIKKSQDTIQKQTPNLHFLVKNFNLYNSEIKINKPDFKVSTNIFNPLNALYSNCNISLDADVKLVQNEYKVTFKSINFTEKFSQSNLKSFKAKVNLNRQFIQVNDFELESNNSKLSMDIRIDNFDILGNGNKDINKSFLVLDLKSKQFEPKYINLFTTLGFNVKKIDELNFTANGSFDDISIHKAELKFANSFLNFNASLQNIIKGNELKYYVDITNSKLITNDLSKILPDISFNNIKFNAIKINQIIGEGTVEGITTKLDFESDFGTMYGDAYFGFG